MGGSVPLDDRRVVEVDRIFAEVLEPPDAVTEHDRHEVDVDCVEQARSKALLGDLGAGHRDVPVASGVLRKRNRLSEPSTNVKISVCGQSVGGSWVTTKIGTPPRGCVPPQPSAMSNTCRPATRAPQPASALRM